MNIYLLRHGRTAFNREKRYQGRTDVPLSPEGSAELSRADFSPDTVYVTALRRTAQTAAILFSGAGQTVVAGLEEMNFGIFEGKNYLEMEHDPAYRAWVDSGCEGTCPGGESKAEFSRRVCRAFEELVDQALERGEKQLVIVAHGGTQMAVLDRYVRPRRDYYSWRAPNGGGWLLSARSWRETRTLELLERVQYSKTKEETP